MKGCVQVEVRIPFVLAVIYNAAISKHTGSPRKLRRKHSALRIPAHQRVCGVISVEIRPLVLAGTSAEVRRGKVVSHVQLASNNPLSTRQEGGHASRTSLMVCEFEISDDREREVD